MRGVRSDWTVPEKSIRETFSLADLAGARPGAGCRDGKTPLWEYRDYKKRTGRQQRKSHDVDVLNSLATTWREVATDGE